MVLLEKSKDAATEPIRKRSKESSTGQFINDREVRNLATALLVHCHRLFTFLEEEGVEPTNNVAERSLRIAVQWRKISFGNRSGNGETAVARLLTVTQTCKRQRRHVLAYLTDAVHCHRCRVAAPSLLPSAALTT